MEGRADFGLIGIGTMGSNLALNLEDHGISVAFWDLNTESSRAFAAAHPGRDLTVTTTLQDLAGALERPRRILLMIPAGAPIDQSLSGLVPYLESGDVVIDGGNSLFHDTRRRAADLAARGIAFFGVGVSGGSEGAREGPSLMPGGPEDAYPAIAPALESIAARTETGPCVGWLGPDGAGHFVKMVHNGIEYADMQAIAEAYDLLRRGLGFEAGRIADTMAEWNRGPLGSYLLEITVDVLRVEDAATGEPLVDSILDEAEQKGTGRWTARTAASNSRAIPARGEPRSAAAFMVR